MARNVPSYLDGIIADSGDLQAEILLGLVEATEEQTDAIKDLAKEVGAVALLLAQMTTREEG